MPTRREMVFIVGEEFYIHRAPGSGRLPAIMTIWAAILPVTLAAADLLLALLTFGVEREPWSRFLPGPM